jgi:hypothetical protein
VPHLLAALPSATDVYFDSVSRVEVPRWSTGRIALLGDDASGATLSGTGTGTAIVGAYALAGELATQVTITPKPFGATSSSYGRTPFGTRTAAALSRGFSLPGVEPRCGFVLGYAGAVWAAGSLCASPSRRTALCCLSIRGRYYQAPSNERKSLTAGGNGGGGGRAGSDP